MAQGFRAARFNEAFRSALNFLGGLERGATASFSARLKSAANADLARFAAARAERLSPARLVKP